MDYFAGLDVSLDTISICIVNADGDILLEKKVDAEPAAIVAVLKYFGRPVKRIGLEAGPTRHGYRANCAAPAMPQSASSAVM